jgi:hypothetical protein
VTADKGTQQVDHAAASPLEGFAVDDLDAHRALLTSDFAVRGPIGIRHALDPAGLVQGRVDELGARVGFVVASCMHWYAQ